MGRLGERVAMLVGGDFQTGLDGNGYRRYAFEYQLPEIRVFVNPRDHWQLYGAASFTLGGVWFKQGPNGRPVADYPDGWLYLGGNFGGGVEVFLSKSTSIDFDLRYVVRARIDGEKAGDALAPVPDFDRDTRTDSGVRFATAINFF
jgi:hypothetical protein